MERVQKTAATVAKRAFAAAISSIPGAKALFVEQALYDTRTGTPLCLRAFADNAFLLEHGVRDVVPFPSKRAENVLLGPAPPRTVVFLLRGISARGALDLIRLLRARIAPQQKQHNNDTKTQTASVPPLKILVLVTPRTSTTIQRILNTLNVGDDNGSRGGIQLRVEALPLGFLPYDSDVLSLDWPSAYREFVIGGDTSAILAAANGLNSFADTLRLKYAPIRSAGPAAAAVAEEILETQGRRYARMGVRRPRPTNTDSNSNYSGVGNQRPGMMSPPYSDVPDDVSSVAGSEIYGISEAASTAGSYEGASARAPTPTFGQLKNKRTDVPLILLDRGVDIVSTLLSQWTYEGLLDESLGLANNTLVVPVSELKTEDAAAVFRAPDEASRAPGGSLMRLNLRTQTDALFAEVRDMSYWAASSRIGDLASDVKEYYSARPERGTAEIGDVRNYVTGLKEKKSEHRRASEHLALAAEISARTFEHIPFKRRFEFERELLEGGTVTKRDVYVGETIATGESLEHILRLACLWSITSAGIDGQVLNFVRKEIVASFGLKALPLLSNLERAGLLTKSARVENQTGGWLSLPGFGRGNGANNNNSSNSGNGTTNNNNSNRNNSPSANMSDGGNSSDRYSVSSATSNAQSRASAPGGGSGPQGRGGRTAMFSWHFARAALRLVSTFDPEAGPEEDGGTYSPAAAYLGYTPLSVRLIEAGLSREGWAKLPPVAPHTSLLPIGYAAVEHRGPPEVITTNNSYLPFDAVVVFVGGVMRAEMSSIRQAAKMANKNILVLTTHVVGADEFVASFAENNA